MGCGASQQAVREDAAPTSADGAGGLEKPAVSAPRKLSVSPVKDLTSNVTSTVSKTFTQSVHALDDGAEAVVGTVVDGSMQAFHLVEDGTMQSVRMVQGGVDAALDASVIAMQAMWRGKKGREAADRAFVRKTLDTDHASIKRNSEERLTRVNQYSLSKVLGKGAFGEVWKGSSGLGGIGGETVAIKVLNRSILKRKRVGRNGNAYDGVLREIAVMKRLQHTHVVNLYEVIDDPENVRSYATCATYAAYAAYATYAAHVPRVTVA